MVIDNLNKGENSFRRLAENLPGIVYRVLLEDDNRMIFFNDMVQTMTGYSPEDLNKGKVCSIDPLILPEDRVNVINIVKDAIENNISFEVEYRINNKSGELKWFLERGRPIQGDNGNPSYIDGVIFDITHQKEAEKKLKTSKESLKRLNKELEQRLEERILGLRESEKKFKTIFDESPIGIELYDSNGNFVDTNEACLDIFGVSSIDDVRGFELFKDPNIPKEHLIKLKKGQTIRLEILFDFDLVKDLNLYETKKSGKIWIDLLISPLYLEENNTISIYLVQLQDITERKIAEQKLKVLNEELDDRVQERTKQLKESENRYKSLADELEVILDHIPGIVVYKDTENIILRVNKFMADAHNLEKTEMENRSSFDFYPKDIAQAYWEDDLEVINSKKPKLNIVEPWEIDAGSRWVNTSKIPYIDENGNVKGIIAIAFDITERKKMMEELRIKDIVFNASLSGQSTSDINGIINHVNPAFLELWGYKSKEEPIGNSIRIFFANSDDATPILEALNEMGKWEGEFLAKRCDGSTFISQGFASAIYDENGDQIGFQSTNLNITKRKEAELKVKSEKEKAQNYLDIAGVIIVALNADQTVQLINQKGCEILGVEESEIIGMNWFDNHIPENVREQVKKDFNRILSGEIEPLENYENAVITKKGKQRIIAWHNHILKNKAGQIIGTLSSGLDITTRKRSEEKFREQNVFLNNILKSLTHPFYVINVKDYTIKLANATASSEGLEQGKYCYSLTHHNNKPCEAPCVCPLEEVKNTKKLCVVEHTHYDKEGNEKIYEIYGYPILDENGNVVQMIEYALNITPRKIAQRELKESEKKYRHLFENSPYYIILLDKEGNFIDCNNSTVDIYGYPKEDFLGKNFREMPIIPPELLPLLEHKIELLFKGEMTSPLEFIPIRKDGKKIWINSQASLIKLDNEYFIYIIGQDITERKKADRKLKESEEKYRHIVESIPIGMHIYQLDANNNLVLIGANPAADKILGVNNNQFIGKTIEEAFPPLANTEIPEKYRQAAKEGKTWSTENVIYDDELIRGAFDVSVFQISPKKMVASFIDITDRKRTEQRLKKSEEKYRDLFESSPISLWEEDFSELRNYFEIIKNSGIKDFRAYFDKNPEEVKKCLSMIKIVDINKKTIELYKANSKEDFFAGLDKVFTEESLDTFKELIITLAGGKTRFESEAINCTFTGDKLYIFLVCEIVAGFKENWSKVLISIVDISERKKAEQALKVSEEIYRSFVENFQGIAYQGYEDYTADFFHGAVEEITGYTPEDFKSGRIKWNQLFHPEDASKFQIQQQKFGESLQTQLEYRIKAKDGSTHWILSKTQKFYDETKKKLCVRGIFIDITDKKKAEQQLKESEQKFRTIAERTFMGIVILQDDQIKYVNIALLQIFGYSYEEISNLEMDDFTRLIHPDDFSSLREYRESLKMGETSLKQYISYRVFTKLGKVKWIDQFSKEIQYKGRPAELITIIDITEKKEAEQELIKLHNMKSELLRRTSHELKTPLVSIKGFSDLLLELHRDKLDNYVIKTIEQIRMGCNRLESLVNDILKTSELESGTVELEKSNEDLSLLIKICVSELEGLLELRNHTINLEISDNLICSFEKKQIYNVITNILSNAIKYTPFSGKIEVKSEITNDFIIISIKDNGIGFLKEEKTLIFKRFGKIERYGQGYDVISEGSGLGLYISKKIMEMHGGEIWVESKGRDKGSTFYFSLPLV